MARPRSADRDEDIRGRLLDAAERAFGARGYGVTRLEDVAGAAGIRRPSLLYHFGSKRGLYEAVIERAFTELGARLDGVLERGEAGLSARVEAVSDELACFAQTRSGVLSLILRELIDTSGPGAALLRAQLFTLVDRLEAVVREEAGGLVSGGFPIRDGIVALMMSHLVRAAAGEEGAALWSAQAPARSTATLARALMIGAQAEGRGAG